MDTACAK